MQCRLRNQNIKHLNSIRLQGRLIYTLVLPAHGIRGRFEEMGVRWSLIENGSHPAFKTLRRVNFHRPDKMISLVNFDNPRRESIELP